MDVKRPPFLVPPSDHDLWDEEEDRVYSSWKSRARNCKLSKDDFRAHIIDINNEFDMEDAFEKLVAFCSKQPKYSLGKDIEEWYLGKENLIVKDFIKWGENFVRKKLSAELDEKVEVDEKMVETRQTVGEGEEYSHDSGIDDKVQEVDSGDEQVAEWPEQVGDIEAAHTEEPNKNSTELSYSSVPVPYSPSSQPPIICGFSSATTIRSVTYWRPWEDSYKDSSGDGDIVTCQKSLVTPPKPYFSSMSDPVSPHPPTPQGRLIRKAKKRSAGDLAKRRQRLVSFQLHHTPPSTPSTPYRPEPEQSPLESGIWGSHPGSWRLDLKESSASRRLDLVDSSSKDLSSPGIPLVQRRQLEDYSNHTNPYLLYPSSPLSWWPSPGCSSLTSPGPCPPPTWLPSNMAPTSPAYCDGCQRWGNLLSVTVSQTRAS
jgi:hypothetical protein